MWFGVATALEGPQRGTTIVCGIAVAFLAVAWFLGLAFVVAGVLLLAERKFAFASGSLASASPFGSSFVFAFESC